MSSVLQEWVTGLNWKMQSVLLAATRGPDHIWCPRIKQINRWIRQVTQQNADPKDDFMVVKKLPAWDDELEYELGYVPLHYYQHLMHSLEIIAYKSPDKKLAEIAWKYYFSMVHMLHLNEESESELDHRLQDQPREKIPAIPPIVFPQRKKDQRANFFSSRY